MIEEIINPQGASRNCSLLKDLNSGHSGSSGSDPVQPLRLARRKGRF